MIDEPSYFLALKQAAIINATYQFKYIREAPPSLTLTSI
jgi:hypothetical protein